MERENKKRRLNLGDIIRKMNQQSPTPKNIIDPHRHKHDRKKPAESLPKTLPILPVLDLPEQPSVKKVANEQPATDSIQKDTAPATSEKKVIEPTSDSAATFQNEPQSNFPLSTGAGNVPMQNQPLDNEDEEEFDLFRYLSVIMRRKEIIILAAITMGLFSLFSYLKSTKYYMARARLLYRPNQESIISDRTTWRFNADRDRNFNTHLELLKSNIVLERVTKNLGNTILPGVITGGLKIRAGETGGEETNIIELAFQHTDPEVSRDVLNELCRTYVEYRREVNAQEDTRLILKLKIQIDKIQNDLDTKESALRRFKEKHRLVQLSLDAHRLSSKLADMEIALQQTQLNLLESKERLTTLRAEIGLQEVNVVQSMTYENPMHSRLAELELELNTISGEYSPDHFKIKQITQQIDNLKQALKSEIEKEVSEKAVKHTLVKNPIRESLLQTFVNQTIEISAWEAKRIAQEQIIEKLEAKMEKLPSMEQEFAFLQRETESLLKTLKMLKMKFEETRIKRDSKESELKILELAKLPKIAFSSKKFSSIFIGLFIGLIIGIACVFLLEYLDQSLKEPTEVEKYLEIPLIGMVPLLETKNAIVDDEILKKSMLEPFRTLRANIKHIASQHQAKTFMMCSAVKGEGKTTLAINLAIAFAMDGKKVILIDCDLRRSQIHNLLNIKKESGLSDYLTDRKSLNEIIKPSIHDNLSVITSGERPHNPAELLGIPKFSTMLQELKSYADIIISDSPALIPVSDSMTMAPHMDCCIMVVRALWTPLKAAKQAKNQLLRIGTKLVGGILNGVSHSRGYYPYYYGYYGYYSYKYSYDYDKEPAKKLTIRELGLSFETKIKTIIQNIGTSIPRTISLFGNLFKHLLRRSLFWILLLLLIAVTTVRYFLVPPHKEKTNSLITYLENGRTPIQEQNPPIAVNVPFPEGKDRQKPVGVTDKETAVQHTSYQSSDYQSSDFDKTFALQESLTVWMNAFNSSDASRFIQFYDPENFEYPGGGFNTWRREMNLNLSKKINQDSIISIDNISVKKIKNNYTKTEFNAIIINEGATLSVEKTMIWKYRKNRWRIIREKSRTLP